MLNLTELINSIQELESGPTTYSNCSKLASLYIVRDHLNPDYQSQNLNDKDIKKEVIKEYSDILPEYTEYCKIKREYQLQKVPKDKVISEIMDVCNEITEFINCLYSNSDMPEEREQILAMIKELQKINS